MKWIITGEGANPNSYVWRVGLNGTTSVSTSSYESYRGAYMWSGIAVAFESHATGDNSSTPFTRQFNFYVPALTDAERYYTLTMQTGNSSTYSFHYGRTMGGAGSDDNENAPLFAFIEEIAGPYGTLDLR